MLVSSSPSTASSLGADQVLRLILRVEIMVLVRPKLLMLTSSKVLLLMLPIPNSVLMFWYQALSDDRPTYFCT